MYKIDLHTHSSASPDGGITAAQYQHALERGMVDVVAITDHNTIELAQALHSQLGDKIIVGEEIMTTHGEIVGLYLEEVVPAGLSPEETIRRIKDQHGLVYIPHPFETVRKGVSPETLESIADYVDIIEVCNGRAFLQNRSAQTVVWARLNHIPAAASSDAHGIKGLGRTFTDIEELPTRDTLAGLLDKGVLRTSQPTIQALLYPKYHRLRKRMRSSR